MVFCASKVGIRLGLGPGQRLIMSAFAWVNAVGNKFGWIWYVSITVYRTYGMYDIGTKARSDLRRPINTLYEGTRTRFQRGIYPHKSQRIASAAFNTFRQCSAITLSTLTFTQIRDIANSALIRWNSESSSNRCRTLKVESRIRHESLTMKRERDSTFRQIFATTLLREMTISDSLIHNICKPVI